MDQKWHRVAGKRAVGSARKGSGQALHKRVHSVVPWRMEKSLQGRQGEAGGPSRHRREPGKGTEEGEVRVNSCQEFRMGSVGCWVGCRDAEPGCGSPAWCEGPSDLWSLGLVLVVEALGSDLIRNLREVTSHLCASVSPSINEDSSSATSQMTEG